MERELINHRTLRHPHIIAFQEVSCFDLYSICRVMASRTGVHYFVGLFQVLCSSITAVAMIAHCNNMLPQKRLLFAVGLCHSKRSMHCDGVCWRWGYASAPVQEENTD